MRFRRFVLFTALYLILDLTNPFVGCAFNFNADESMEGVSRQHERLLRQAADFAVPVRPALEIDRARAARLARPEVRPLAEWLASVRQIHAPTSDPQSATEDH